MTSKHKILVPSIVTALAIAATIVGTTTLQLLPHEAKAQGKATLLAGQLTAASNGKPFGGQPIGSYAVTPSGQRVDIHLHIDKPPTAGNVLEAWLVDTKANYSLSLGQVDTAINPPSLTFSQTMVNPYAYNQIIITQEPLKDPNPKPSQPIGGTALEAPFGA
jgi:hypothetical protein